MNDNLNKEVITLPPFKRLCMTIGELPSSYVETMTYYESLLWFCNYLGKTVIPTINNNAEAVEELQTKYIELKDYVGVSSRSTIYSQTDDYSGEYMTNPTVPEEYKNVIKRKKGGIAYE